MGRRGRGYVNNIEDNFITLRCSRIYMKGKGSVWVLSLYLEISFVFSLSPFLISASGASSKS